jgi:tight adherence protein B
MNDSTGDLTLTVTLMGIGVAIAAALILMSLSMVLDKTGSRQRQRLERARGLSRGSSAKQEKVSVRLDVSDSSIASFDRLLKRIVPNPKNLRDRLAMTGRKIALGQYVLSMVITALVAYVGIELLCGFKFLVTTAFAVALGLFLPHFIVGRMITRRLNRFTILFPEAIDLIVRGLKSGLPVPESIKIVGSEMPDPIGVEFRRIGDSFGLGVTLEQALTAAARRIDTAEFKFFVISLSVQRETGGNLTETLENLSNILRRRKQMKLKIRAMSSEARASAYIIGALPFIMFGLLIWMNPEYAMMLIKDSRGQIMLGAAITSLLGGILVMIKMAKFDV